MYGADAIWQWLAIFFKTILAIFCVKSTYFHNFNSRAIPISANTIAPIGTLSSTTTSACHNANTNANGPTRWWSNPSLSSATKLALRCGRFRSRGALSSLRFSVAISIHRSCPLPRFCYFRCRRR
jgi:hypothetical protein